MANMSARLTYFGFFLASLLMSWILAELAAPLLQNLPWINATGLTKEWYQMSAVFRVSMGNFLFFMVLALTMVGVKSKNDQRDSWHHGRWIVKITTWLLLVILMFFVPNEVVYIYALLSKFGAGLFLLLQFVLLLDYTSKLHDAWFELDEPNWYLTLYALAAGCFIAGLAFYITLFSWFVPSGPDCSFNALLICISLLLAFLLAFVVMINERGLLPGMAIFVYCAYVCYTGLSSEPRNEVCNGLHDKDKTVSLSSLILGITSTILSLFYAAGRAGSIQAILSSSSPKEANAQQKITFAQMFLFRPDSSSHFLTINELENTLFTRPVKYSYTLFHTIFALASMYSAMLLSLLTGSSDKFDLSDVGWTSALVKICAGYMTVFVYIHIIFITSLE